MQTLSMNIMKLLNGLASNKWITINDEEKVKKFISNFDRYENKRGYEIVPDYNTEKRNYNTKEKRRKESS